MRRIAVLATVVFALAGCGTEGEVDNDEVAGSNRPSASSSSDQSASPSSSMAPAPAANPTFGETYTYDDGLSVMISAPQPYTPSGSANAPATAAHVVFDVTVVNGTPANYEPSQFSASMQSGNVEAAQVYDSANGIGGAPSTVLLPGRESTFRLAFGADDPADLVLELRPSFDYDSAIFTS